MQYYPLNMFERLGISFSFTEATFEMPNQRLAWHLLSPIFHVVAASINLESEFNYESCHAGSQLSPCLLESRY